jgi:bifunctional DNA-binding transcriptional regulator/antitoxin component of YhaV-PrlF toxin-antitoxin module
MGFVTKIQRVDRPTNQSFYVVMPVALAQAFELDKGEEFEWIIEDKNLLLLKRVNAKKKITSKKVKE